MLVSTPLVGGFELTSGSSLPNASRATGVCGDRNLLACGDLTPLFWQGHIPVAICLWDESPPGCHGLDPSCPHAVW